MAAPIGRGQVSQVSRVGQVGRDDWPCRHCASVERRVSREAGKPITKRPEIRAAHGAVPTTDTLPEWRFPRVATRGAVGMAVGRTSLREQADQVGARWRTRRGYAGVSQVSRVGRRSGRRLCRHQVICGGAPRLKRSRETDHEGPNPRSSRSCADQPTPPRSGGFPRRRHGRAGRHGRRSLRCWRTSRPRQARWRTRTRATPGVSQVSRWQVGRDDGRAGHRDP